MSGREWRRSVAATPDPATGTEVAGLSLLGHMSAVVAKGLVPMRLIALASSVSLLVLAAACGARSESEPASAAMAGAQLETRPANGRDQTPAFAGQTRAPGVTSDVKLVSTVLASGLEHPWGLALLPDGRWLVTERAGRLRIVTAEGDKGEPIMGLPAVDARGQGGLFDVAVGPTFATDRMIYWAYAEPRKGGNATSVARGRLSDDGTKVESVQVIFRALPTYDGDKHFGGALAFAADGKLFITLGERSDSPCGLRLRTSGRTWAR